MCFYHVCSFIITNHIPIKYRCVIKKTSLLRPTHLTTTRATLYLKLDWGIVQNLRIWPSRITQFHHIQPPRVVPRYSLIPCDILSGTILVPNIWNGLKKSGEAFPHPKLSTWAGLGSSNEQWTSQLAVYGSLILFTTLSSWEHHDLKSSLITLFVTRLGPNKIW